MKLFRLRALLRISLAIMIVGLILIPKPASSAAIIRVPTDVGSIQGAIGAAANGDEVVVEPGLYFERLDLSGKAITVRSKHGAEVTIVDGSNIGPVVAFTSGENTNTVLEGFTLRNGRTGDDGGGIRIRNASPTIRGNIVRNNFACIGAGIAISYGSPIIQGNVITANRQAGCIGGTGGAGINIGGRGGTGQDHPQILENIITHNYQDGNGGGVLVGAGSIIIRNNIIGWNTAANLSPCAKGGGIALTNFLKGEIVQNLLIGNRAGCGGGVSIQFGDHPVVMNNTIADNHADSGSGIYSDTSTAKLFNNIIVASPGQIAMMCGGFANYLTFTSNNVFSPSGSAYGGHCGDQTGQNGNISQDPRFSNPLTSDYQLQSGSPGIDAGSHLLQTELPVQDLAANSRSVDGDENGAAVVDMGVYEFAPKGFLQFSATSYRVPEGFDAEVMVIRNSGAKGVVSVDFHTRTDTATPGLDYTPVFGTLTFGDGERLKKFIIPATADDVNEGKESVLLALNNATNGAVLGRTDSASLVITDNSSINLFPLYPGSVWSYARSDGGTSNLSIQEKLVGVNGFQTAVISDSVTRTQNFYTNDANGILLHRQVTPNALIEGLGSVNLTATFSPPIRFLDFAVEAGQTAFSTGLIVTNRLPRRIGVLEIPYQAAFTVDEAGEIVVPAGTFKATRIVGQITTAAGSEVMVLYLAENLGVIQSDIPGVGGIETLQLLSTNAGTHDLAVTKIIVPKSVTLTVRRPIQTKTASIEIQNRSGHSEIVPDVESLGNFVSLRIASLGNCVAPTPRLQSPRRLPLILRPKAKMTVDFDVDFSCANDPGVGVGREDFRYEAIVNRAGLDGAADLHNEDDVCPRSGTALDPYPDASITERGCGSVKADGSLGGLVLTDVIVK